MTGGRTARRRERSRLVRVTRLLRTGRPRTFREKVRYKMLRDHRQLLVTFADKWAVRDYVSSKIGAGYLPAVYGLVDDPAGLRTLTLPGEYVVKPTHGSGAVVVVSPAADAAAELPPARYSWVYAHVRPAAADLDRLVDIAAHWLSQLYGQGPNKEWAYGPVPRRVIVEELLHDADGNIPEDYKLFVFHGVCHFVQVDAGRFGRRTQDFYTPTWDHLPLSGGLPWQDPPPPRPALLAEMIDLAERLGADTDFVRVDLYHLPGRIVFGELTSYPAGGHSPFDPPEYDEIFGRPWSVPRRYR